MVVLVHRVLYGVTCITKCEGNSHTQVFPLFSDLSITGSSVHGCGKFQGHGEGAGAEVNLSGPDYMFELRLVALLPVTLS